MALGVQVTFEAANPRRLAQFWALALDYEVEPEGPGEEGLLAAVVDPAGKGPRLLFQRVPDGRTVKNRVRIDVNASAPRPGTEQGWEQVRARAAVLTQGGATVLREVHDATGRCLVLQDPEGNEFRVR
ncbi:glyoxalase [Prauserella sp. PE36]|uniref:VOC family protein n=1 Tax=Prauserella endophytica TaxID=1592324 RepID=A0ABY2RYB3_9PSEU|nr:MULTISPECIES: VOC family protein [Prauserella]PXY24783.1 glyoxalase [Prauserella coralliicola]RBM22946.1 glyoxalase [Prauserella sp. PE36]TKG65206.1 VOC family protein [Prauserella endophytica]